MQWELFWDWWVRDRCPPPTDDARLGEGEAGDTAASLTPGSESLKLW